MPDSYVIFTGRPNAGKSTVIRALTGLKISIGKRPGTTTKINKYQISQDLYIVDMPGYGTKIDATKRWEDKTKDRILDFIEQYADDIVAVVHVLNISTFIETEERLAKKGFISIDVEMIQYLEENLAEYPLVAANKIDKGNDSEIMQNLDAFLNSLSDGEPQTVASYVFPISAKKGVGIGALKNELVSRLYKSGFMNPFDYIR
jgi:GTP-binding protein EngB required for normal cell division